MADLVTCEGAACPLKKSCGRYLTAKREWLVTAYGATPNKALVQFAAPPFYRDTCNHFTAKEV